MSQLASKEIAYYSVKGKSELPAQTQAAIAQGRVKLQYETMYVKKKVSGNSGTVDLIDFDTTYREGTTNFDGNKLPQYQNHFFSTVQIGYGIDSAETDPALIQYTNVINTTNLDIALRGAILKISQNSRVLVNTPVDNAFTEVAIQAPRGSAENGLDLKGVYVLREQQPITMTLTFPKNAAGGQQTVASATERFIEVKIPGMKTVAVA